MNFIIINLAPGSPVEKIMYGSHSTNGTTFSTAGQEILKSPNKSTVNDQATFDKLSNKYGLDQPMHIRFITMVKNYSIFNLGNSFVYEVSVISLIKDRIAVSFSLSLISVVLMYAIAIPIGIKQAVKHNKSFDKITTIIMTVFYGMPDFLLAVLLIIFFAGSAHLNIFPLRGLTSANHGDMSFAGRIFDYFMHLCLPIAALTPAGIAFYAKFCKNSFTEEMAKKYVITAIAKGLNHRTVLLGHIFGNALMSLFANMPRKIMKLVFGGTLLIEVMFSINGFGVLLLESVTNRDYPVIFGILYVTAILQLLTNIACDIICVLFDKRITFTNH